jgi:hypothetical protein
MMNHRLSSVSVVLCLAFGIGVAGCNSSADSKNKGTSSSSGATTQQTAVSIGLSGQVATGAFADGVNVQVFDNNGKRCGTTKTDANGKFTIKTDACELPFVVAAEAKKTEGYSLFTFVTSETAAQPFVITPITTAYSTIVLGDHPLAVTGSLKGKLEKLITKERMQSADDKIRQMLKPVLAAFSADKLDFKKAPLTLGQGIDAVLDQAIIQVDADTGLRQYQISVNLPNLNKPIILRNSIGESGDKAYFDAAHGSNPSDVSESLVLKIADDSKGIRSFFRKIYDGQPGGRSAYVDKCYLHDGQTRVGESFVDKNYQISAIRVTKYNTYSDFDNEELQRQNYGGGTLAYVSLDLTTLGGRVDRFYTWIIKGAQTLGGCTSTGDDWRILGNQRKIKIALDSYLVLRTEYNSAFLDPQVTTGSGLSFHISDPSDIGVSHVIVTGPALPADGVVLIKTSYGFLRYKGDLPSLRSAAKASTFDPDKVVNYFNGIALTDQQIAPVSGIAAGGITDGVYDSHNSYVYRIFNGFDQVANVLTYRLILPKRPYMSSEVSQSMYPILAANKTQLLASMTTFSPVHVEFTSPLDGRGIPLKPRGVWLQRQGFIIDKQCLPEKPDQCTEKKDDFIEFVAPGSFVDLDGGVNVADINPSMSEGELQIGAVRFESVDSFGRPIEIQHAINLKK